VSPLLTLYCLPPRCTTANIGLSGEGSCSIQTRPTHHIERLVRAIKIILPTNKRWEGGGGARDKEPEWLGSIRRTCYFSYILAERAHEAASWLQRRISGVEVSGVAHP
jgi:hypothetical protein